MFTKEISSITLTGETADSLFDSITADSFGRDTTFAATMRALLHRRLPANETAHLALIPLDYGAHTPETIIGKLRQYDLPYSHAIYIVYPRDKCSGQQMLDAVTTDFGAEKRFMYDYTRREDLRIFYARKLNAMFYTDESKGRAVIFTDKLELKQYHALQMMIPMFLPGLFSDKPLTESETALLKSTGNKTSAEYELLIEGFAKELDIRSENIRTKLTGFETVFERNRLSELRSEISRRKDDYDNYLTYIRDTAQNIQSLQYTLAGLECAINDHSGESELMEYFMCNKNLSVIRVNGTAIEFVAHGYADVYDADAFEQYAGNHNGYMYSDINPAVTEIQMERLYRAIFGENKYKLRLCAAYIADMRNGLRACSNYVFPPESRTYLPNPHIQHFGCVGTYAGRFQVYMNNGDYVGAIDQAVVSGRNLNFYDPPVISHFASELSHSKIRCIERPDGSLLTPLEAIKELEEAVSCPDQ